MRRRILAKRRRVYDHIMRSAERLVPVAKEVNAAYGVPIVNKRIAVTPIALVGEPSGAASYVPLAQALDRAAEQLGIDYIAGFSAIVEKALRRATRCYLTPFPRHCRRQTESVARSTSRRPRRHQHGRNCDDGPCDSRTRPRRRRIAAASAAPSWSLSRTCPKTIRSSLVQTTASAKAI